MSCPVCESQFATVTSLGALDQNSRVSCPRCGNFAITFAAAEDLTSRRLQGKQRLAAAYWIRTNEGTLITTAQDSLLRTVSMPSVRERAMGLLKAIAEKTSSLDELVSWGHDQQIDEWWMGATASSSQQEVTYLAKEYLQNGLNCVQVVGQAIGHFANVKILPKGYELLELPENKDSVIGFCAMWFDNQVLPLWQQAIEPAIKEAGWQPLRVDSIEHSGKIDDKIFASIRQSRFVVADFTAHRGGVYFEAGYAQGLGLPVVWTCRADSLGELHFDVRQYNCITWTNDNLNEFRNRLKIRIEAVLGHGAVPSR
jgi:hypothetical protein